MAWLPPIVARVDNLGRFFCSACCRAREITGEPVHGDYWPALDDVCESCGVQPPHIGPADYVQVAPGHEPPEL